MRSINVVEVDQSAYPLLSADFLTTYVDERMRLITRVYCTMVCSEFRVTQTYTRKQNCTSKKPRVSSTFASLDHGSGDVKLLYY